MGTLLDVSHLTIGFLEQGQMHKVVDDISFKMEEGQILGVVGESGSGKSMTALAAMGLLSKEAQILGGNIRFMDEDVLYVRREAGSKIRGNDMTMIFQEPMTSLNPVMKIGRQVGESLILHQKVTKAEVFERVLEALRDVGLKDAEKIYHHYPHELSGGMRQRVMIAQAMICSPKLLIADEPTTALDVVVQAQILSLLKKLHRQRGVSILFISHDLNVIRQLCTDVLVMYQGVIVEQGKTEAVLEHPQHEYTKTLVAAIPDNETPIPESAPVLSLKNLNAFYEKKAAGIFGKKVRQRVVKNINLDIREGEILGIVGESGCGKSTLARTIVGLNPYYEGQIVMADDVHPQMVFQDPFGSLNPARRIGWIMTEALRVCGVSDKKTQYAMVCEMLTDIGLDETYYHRYAHELSGGQRQRISIGTALLMKSRLLVADEPVSALDVTVQSQILSLLLEIHRKRGLTILFISHDLSVVQKVCHRVAVLYMGEIVELADVDEIYANPLHPYTRLLMAVSDAENVPDAPAEEARKGCAFAGRCAQAQEQCFTETTALTEISKGHFVRCLQRNRW